jgi:UDP-glucose 4-epimerase
MMDNLEYMVMTIPTADGTCMFGIMCMLKILLEHMLWPWISRFLQVYNLGSNSGTSVKQVMERARKIIGKMPYIGVEARREGDPAELTASLCKV